MAPWWVIPLISLVVIMPITAWTWFFVMAFAAILDHLWPQGISWRPSK